MGYYAYEGENHIHYCEVGEHDLVDSLIVLEGILQSLVNSKYLPSISESDC